MQTNEIEKHLITSYHPQATSRKVQQGHAKIPNDAARRNFRFGFLFEALTIPA